MSICRRKLSSLHLFRTSLQYVNSLSPWNDYVLSVTYLYYVMFFLYVENKKVLQTQMECKKRWNSRLQNNSKEIFCPTECKVVPFYFVLWGSPPQCSGTWGPWWPPQFLPAASWVWAQTPRPDSPLSSGSAYCWQQHYTQRWHHTLWFNTFKDLKKILWSCVQFQCLCFKCESGCAVFFFLLMSYAW